MRRVTASASTSVFAGIGALGLVSGCGLARTASPIAYVRPVVVVAPPTIVAPARLSIVVRDFLEPDRPLAGALISVRSLSAPAVTAAPAPLAADSAGRMVADTLRAGNYELFTRRLGYIPIRTRIHLPNFPSWVEVYLPRQVCDIGPCGRPPVGRVVFTSCMDAA